MKAEPRALFLTPEAPYPAVGGGPLRLAALFEYVTARSRLDAIVFREPQAPDPRSSRVSDLARRVHIIDIPFHSKAHLARFTRNLSRCLRGAPPLTDRFAGFERQITEALGTERYDFAVLEHFWCAPYAELLARHAGSLILDLHNVESVFHGRCARIERWPVSAIHRRFASVCRGLERKWLPVFSRVLVPSESDAAAVRSVAPGARVFVYPNTIPEVLAPERREEDGIAFTANMEYPPNAAAVRYFRSEVWPRLRERWPDLEWRLIGKRPEAVARYVNGDPRIRLIGPVEDAIAALSQAKVAVVPLHAGSGTRMKILEAWAAGTPVVSTSLGAEGIPAADGEHLLIADTPETFAAAVSALLESAELRRRIGAAGRALYERQFTWPAGWSKLENFLRLPVL
mgnify:CR=1 FL=1